MAGLGLFPLTFFILKGIRHILYAEPILEKIDEVHLTIWVQYLTHLLAGNGEVLDTACFQKRGKSTFPFELIYLDIVGEVRLKLYYHLRIIIVINNRKKAPSAFCPSFGLLIKHVRQAREIASTNGTHTHTEEHAVFSKKPNKQTKELGLVQRHLSHTVSISEAVRRDKLKAANLANRAHIPPSHCVDTGGTALPPFRVTDRPKFGLLEPWRFSI